MEFLTCEECAKVLRYKNSKERIYILLRAGVLKGFKRGKMWLVDKQSFEKYCKGMCGMLAKTN